MTLFSSEELSRKKALPFISKSVKLATGLEKFVTCRANQKLDAHLGPPEPFTNIWYTSKGDWSTHDLIFFTCAMSDLPMSFFTTWAISEFAIRQLYLFIQQDLIIELRGIFDYRNGIHKPSELQFLKSITTEIKAGKCHAKVVVIENPVMSIAIVGSANFTRNPRIEAGVISTHQEVAGFHKNWILEELKDLNQDNGNK